MWFVVNESVRITCGGFGLSLFKYICALRVKVCCSSYDIESCNLAGSVANHC